MTSSLPPWPKEGLSADMDRSTVDVPLGQAHVSQVTGEVYMSSDLGFVDVPNPYLPGWALLNEEADDDC